MEKRSTDKLIEILQSEYEGLHIAQKHIAVIKNSYKEGYVDHKAYMIGIRIRKKEIDAAEPNIAQLEAEIYNRSNVVTMPNACKICKNSTCLQEWLKTTFAYSPSA